MFGSLRVRMTMAGQVAAPEVVAHDEQGLRSNPARRAENPADGFRSAFRDGHGLLKSGLAHLDATPDQRRHPGAPFATQ